MNDWLDAEQRVERALELSESRRWVEALAELESALEINSTNASWLAHRGFLLDQLGRHGDAIGAYTEALEIEPEDRDLLFALSLDLAQEMRMTQALATLEKLVALHPDFEPAYCQQIIVYAEMGQHDKAETAFYLGRQLKADCPQCFFHMGLSLSDRGLHQRAIRCWERVLEIAPEFEEVSSHMARAYRSIGELDRAKESFLVELRKDPGNVGILCELGELLLGTGDLEGAAAKFSHAIELSPDQVDAHLALADTLLLAGRAEAAVKILERARELDGERAGIDAKLGLAYLSLNRYAEAKGHLERRLRKASTDVTALLALGNCLLHLRKPVEAAEQFRRAIATDGRNAAAYHGLSTCCLLAGDHALAIKHCQRAMELNPDDPAPMVKAALGYLALGRFRAARDLINRGLRMHPEHDVLQRLSKQFWRYRVHYAAGRFRSMVGRLLGKSSSP
jgi:tetratricopeptide (TPR) repeat protein